jgi:hypothetical protein
MCGDSAALDRRFVMKDSPYCHAVMDKTYEFSGDSPLPFLNRLEIAAHVLFCSHCAAEIVRLEQARSLMRTDFFPVSPCFEDSVMNLISAETIATPEDGWGFLPAVSFRGWVVTGLVILISLSTSFFGMDFMSVTRDYGTSFLLSIGITIGAVVTGYGALFIGSHLKELSDRFGLH